MSLPVVLPALVAETAELWNLLIDLTRRTHDVPWTLIGGQMVLLHGLERGRVAPRVSADIDAIVDIRARPKALRALVDVFGSLGLKPAGPPSPDGVMHRFVRDGSHVAVDLITSVDVLVPEGLGPNTDVETGHGRVVSAPGGTQALNRTERVPVTFEGRTADVPRPDLLGAIVVKAAALEVGRDRQRHLRDLTFLASLVEDPFSLREARGGKDRKRLRSAAAILSVDSVYWTAWGEYADDARSAWQILTAG